MSALQDAVHALGARKSAVVGDESPGVTGIDADSHESRCMTLGFDIDAPELLDFADHVAQFTLRAGLGPRQGIRAAWADGVLTGLMLAELRRP